MLRPATLSDIPRIREMAHRIWWAHYPGIITNAQIEFMLGQMYGVETLERQIREEGHQFWVVVDNGTEAGYAAVSRQSEGVYFLHKFYIGPGQQGRGIGTLVFRALLEQYPDLQELRLTVNRRNFKSINFYFKLGFTIEKCVDIPIGQGFVMDDFQMLWQGHKK